VGYCQKGDAVRKLRYNYRENVDYADLSYDEMNNCDEILALANPIANRGSHNKRFIFLTKFAAYSFIIECQTLKAKEIRCHVIDVYNKYHELLMYCKQKNSQKNFEQSKNDAVKLYQIREDNKHQEYKKQKNREIKAIKETTEEIRRQKDMYKEKYCKLEYEVKKYKQLYKELEHKVDNGKNKLKKLSNEITDNSLKRKIKKEINGLC
jgi:hypothetical protein